MIDFQFADLHCHPTLKTYGQSFNKNFLNENKCASLWYSNPPTFFKKFIQKLLGITRFSQADFTTMINGNVKIAFVSLYPFEKGFFCQTYLNKSLSALISSFITSIGYERVRSIQDHLDYFSDLLMEYEYLVKAPKLSYIEKKKYEFKIVNSFKEIEKGLDNEDRLLLIPTIEGAHVFNTGLTDFGRKYDEDEVLRNIARLKKLKYPPFFITFAHNFNNELCGHAPSLECLGSLVDQSENLDKGFSEFGKKVIKCLLSSENGKPIYLDVKHMSLKSRMEYYNILNKDFKVNIPIIVSHGAVTGKKLSGNHCGTLGSDIFANDTINFYNEEIVAIAKSHGLFGIQLDAKRLAPKYLIKKSLFKWNREDNLKKSALLVWRQLQHIAEVLDSNNLYAWGTCCIGSDFDGTIDTLNEVWTTKDLNPLANEMHTLAKNYLSNTNSLKQLRNKQIPAETVIRNFAFNNALNFAARYYF